MWKKDDNTGFFNMLQFAGSDTSRTISASIIYFLSDKPDLQKKFLSEANEHIYCKDMSLINFDTFDNSEFINLFTHESLRLFNPFIVITPRKLIKNTTLGKYKFTKGTNLVLPVLTMHKMEKFHKNATEFDITRHTKEEAKKRKKMTNVPFWEGKRNCLGKYMGELMIKLFMTQFARHFEWKRDPDYSPRMVQNLTYNHEEMKLWVRPRAKID